MSKSAQPINNLIYSLLTFFTVGSLHFRSVRQLFYGTTIQMIISVSPGTNTLSYSISMDLNIQDKTTFRIRMPQTTLPQGFNFTKLRGGLKRGVLNTRSTPPPFTTCPEKVDGFCAPSLSADSWALQEISGINLGNGKKNTNFLLCGETLLQTSIPPARMVNLG